jgi:PleD family two-component response regulator
MNDHRAIEADPANPSGVTPRTMMVLLVDDQIVIGEAVRRALLDDPTIEFHFCSNPRSGGRGAPGETDRHPSGSGDAAGQRP